MSTYIEGLYFSNIYPYQADFVFLILKHAMRNCFEQI